MEFVRYFIKITLYPVAAILVCGYIVWACKHLFIKLLGHNGAQAVLVTSIVGTPIHELGHAAMCLLFGHEIEELVLWQGDSGDYRLGYVRHTYDPDNLYQRFGNLFIGAGPIFSGMAVLSLLLWLVFPHTWSSYIASVGFLAEHHGSVPEFVSVGMDMIFHMIAEFGSGTGSVWVRILAVLVMLSVSLHISLSPEDMKLCVHAIPLYLMLTLLIAVVTTVIGKAATGLVLAALETYSAFMMAMFTLVMVFAVAQVILAVVIFLIREHIGK